MDSGKEFVTQQDLITIIEDFVSRSSGLLLVDRSELEFAVFQKSDSKKVKLKRTEMQDVLIRKDDQGKDFVQINFSNGKKVLLTDLLVGFKPISMPDLDISKLPRVVTTLDLLSVFEAIEESVTSEAPERADEVDTLKRVFQSILLGAEDVGFDLSAERSWLKRLPTVSSRASA